MYAYAPHSNDNKQLWLLVLYVGITHLYDIVSCTYILITVKILSVCLLMNSELNLQCIFSQLSDLVNELFQKLCVTLFSFEYGRNFGKKCCLPLTVLTMVCLSVMREEKLCSSFHARSRSPKRFISNTSSIAWRSVSRSGNYGTMRAVGLSHEVAGTSNAYPFADSPIPPFIYYLQHLNIIIERHVIIWTHIMWWKVFAGKHLL